ncbi:MAG: hypothetical protein ACPL7C_09030 [Anaerolineae bacterium]
MSSRKVSSGKCFVCGERLAKNAATRHLTKCLPAHDPEKGRKVHLFQIRAEGRYAPGYWLYLEMPASATLADLDDFLRSVWLECCGHLSAFEIAGVRYEVSRIFPGEEEEWGPFDDLAGEGTGQVGAGEIPGMWSRSRTPHIGRQFVGLRVGSRVVYGGRRETPVPEVQR